MFGIMMHDFRIAYEQCRDSPQILTPAKHFLQTTQPVSLIVAGSEACA